METEVEELVTALDAIAKQKAPPSPADDDDRRPSAVSPPVAFPGLPSATTPPIRIPPRPKPEGDQ